MTLTPEELDNIDRLAKAVDDWKLDQAWLDISEDDSAAVVGAINEEGEKYPVVTVDCDQYFQAHDSLPLAKYYATLNPLVAQRLTASIREQAEEIEKLRAESFCLRKDAERYRWLRSDEIGVASGEREILVYLERLPFREDQNDEWLIGVELDSAIDAAIAAQGGEGK